MRSWIGLGFELPPSPLSHQQLVSLSQSSCVSPVELTDGRGGREEGGHGDESYDRKKAWASINHSILSGLSTEITTCRKSSSQILNLSLGDIVDSDILRVVYARVSYIPQSGTNNLASNQRI